MLAATTNVDLKKPGAPPIDDLSAHSDTLADPAQIQGKMVLLNLYALLTDEEAPVEAAEWFAHLNKFMRLDQERFIAEVDGPLC